MQISPVVQAKHILSTIKLLCFHEFILKSTFAHDRCLFASAAGPDALAGEPSVLVSREAVSDGSLVVVLGAIVALCNTTTRQPLCTTWTMATAFPEPRPTDGETALSPGMRVSLIHLGNTYPQVMDREECCRTVCPLL